jgi:hypothetical protein
MIYCIGSRCRRVAVLNRKVSMRKESVNALPKVVGILRVLRFPPTGNVDRVGWD